MRLLTHGYGNVPHEELLNVQRGQEFVGEVPRGLRRDTGRGRAERSIVRGGLRSGRVDGVCGCVAGGFVRDRAEENPRGFFIGFLENLLQLLQLNLIEHVSAPPPRGQAQAIHLETLAAVHHHVLCQFGEPQHVNGLVVVGGAGIYTHDHAYLQTTRSINSKNEGTKN